MSGAVVTSLVFSILVFGLIGFSFNQNAFAGIGDTIVTGDNTDVTVTDPDKIGIIGTSKAYLQAFDCYPIPLPDKLLSVTTFSFSLLGGDQAMVVKDCIGDENYWYLHSSGIVLVTSANDADGDKAPVPFDCDDNDPLNKPDAPGELPDGQDNNCNGLIDEGLGTDFDTDGVDNDLDNCPNMGNPDQLDSDFDGLGNVCDSFPFDPLNDDDNDGIGGSVDNCPIPNPIQTDTDGDNIGDVCDLFQYDPLNDIDNDGIGGDIDNCPTISNTDQLNTDLDLLGNACDADDDNDGIQDELDLAPLTSSVDVSDTGLGGTTTANFLTFGTQILTFSDLTNPLGIQITADSLGGADRATFQPCGKGRVNVTPGDDLVLTCGSVILNAIDGSIDAELQGDDGRIATFTLNAGNEITFHPETFTFEASSDNTETIIITVGTQTISVTPGQTIEVPSEPTVEKKSCDALDKASQSGNGKKKGLEKALANNQCI